MDAPRLSGRQYSLGALLLGVSYLALTWIGQSMSAGNGSPSLLWPGNAAAIVFFARQRRNDWLLFLPPLTLAYALTQAPHPITIDVHVMHWFADMGEIFLGALFVQYATPTLALERIAHVGIVLATALIAPLPGALLSGVASQAGWPPDWNYAMFWWLGDAMGLSVFIPFCLTWCPIGKQRAYDLRSNAGAIAWLLVTSLITYAIFSAEMPFMALRWMAPYILFAPLLIATLRYGFAGATAHVIAVAITSTKLTLLGKGPFAMHDTLAVSDIAALDTFLFTVASVSLIVATLWHSRSTAQAALAGNERSFRVALEQRIAERTELLSKEIAMRQATETALRDSEERLLLASSAANIALWEWRPEANTIYYSPIGLANLGLPPDAKPPTPAEWRKYIHPDDWHHVVESSNVLRQRTDNEFSEMEFRLRKPDGSYRWVLSRSRVHRDADAKMIRVLGCHIDITVRKTLEQHLTHQAQYDHLTQLPNRVLGTEQLKRELAQARRQDSRVGVMFVDLDHFKFVNDTFGHAAGDLLLKEAAHRLHDCVREGDTIARMGGDEFLIVMPNLTAMDQAKALAERIATKLDAPFYIENAIAHVTPSIGIASSPFDGNDADTLLRNADIAMYRAKENGRNTYRFFTAEMNRAVAERQEIESSLRHALERAEFDIAYQPIRDTQTGRWVAAEALVRWNRPNQRAVSAEQFITIAEEAGLIASIGDWVLERACRQTQQWRSEFGTDLKIAVNISPRQFLGNQIVRSVERVLESSGLPAHALELELTERVVLDSTPQTQQTLQQLHSLGVRLSIDDFGTGYSALSYLHRFPFDALKIDRSFVNAVTRDPHSATLAQSIIRLGNDLGMTSIGEGVETAEQLQFLSEQGCEFVQGYFVGRPVTAQEFSADLAQRVTH